MKVGTLLGRRVAAPALGILAGAVLGVFLTRAGLDWWHSPTRDPDSPAGGRARLARAVSEKDVATLIDLVEHPELDVRTGAVRGLGTLGAHAALSRALLDPAPRLRQEALIQLTRLGPTARSTTPALIEALRTEESDWTRARILDVLARVAPDDERAARVAAEALHDPDEGVRASALSALSAVRASRAVALPVLLEVLRVAQSDQMSARMLRVLARVAPDDERVVRSVVHGLRDSRERVRAGALDAVSEMSASRARLVPALIDFLNGEDPLRVRVPRLLGSSEASSEETVTALRSAKSDPDPQVAAAAGQVLAALLRDRPLLDRLGDPDPEIRAEAARELRTAQGRVAPQTLAALVGALSDPAPEVARAATDAIGALGSAAASAEAALWALLDAPDPELARAAEAALRAAGAGPVAGLARHGCRDGCPVYRLAVYRNGSVVYRGNRFVKTMGRRHRRLSRERVQELRDAFEQARFARLLARYWAPGQDQAMVSLSYGGKTILYHPEAAHERALATLFALTERFEAIAGAADWVGEPEEAAAAERQR